MTNNDRSTVLKPALVLICFSICLTLAIQPVFSQIEVFDDPERFSEDALTLEPRFFDGTTINEAFSVLGISFHGERDTRVIRERIFLSLDQVAPLVELVFRHQGLNGAPPEGPLIIDFHRPLRRVGFNLGNGSEDLMARIEVFNPRGSLLGVAEVADVDEQVGPFLGIETEDPTGIAKVVVDYGESERGEQVSSVIFEFLQPRPFRRCLAHVGHGEVGGATFETVLRIDNLAKQSNRLRLEIFDEFGSPMEIFLDGQLSAVFEFQLRFIEARHLLTPSEGEQKVGYACVESSHPIALDAIFRSTLQGGDEMFEAGIDSRAAAASWNVPVQLSEEEDLNVGVALFNPSFLEARVSISLFEDGMLIDSNELIIAPLNRTAMFVTELLPKSMNRSLAGSLAITSTTDIIVTTLRTRRGVAVSSITPGTQQVFENPR